LLGRRLRAGHELLQDLGYLLGRIVRRVGWVFLAAGRALRAAGRALRGFWFRRSLGFRRRFAAVLLVLALYSIFQLVALPGVPCDVSPAEQCPPTDDAIALVPADAYAYAHLNLEPDSSQFEQAKKLADGFPHFDAIAEGIFTALGPGRKLDLSIDVYPWLGDEAAAAELPAKGGAPESLLLAQVGDSAGARALLAKVAGRSSSRHPYRGVEVSIYSRRLASAEEQGFLLLGAPGAVRAAIDVSRGDGGSLADDGRADAARDRLPDDRLADLYVSRDGIDRLLAGRGGLADQLDTFTDFGASEGVAAALVAHHDGLEAKLSSVLDPEAAKAAPSFFSAFPEFDPSLASEFAPDTLALLAVGDLSKTVRSLLDQADAAFPGITDAFDRLSAQLAREGGPDIERDLLPLLSGQVAIGVTPARPLPYVTFVVDDVDEAKTRQAVAELQAPLVAAVNPARTGQAPTLSSHEVDGVEVRGVRISAALDLAYAITDGRLIAATNPRGVEQAIAGSSDLAGTDPYQAATGDASGGVSALVFLNLEGLVKLAEPRGLAEIVSEFSDDLARLKALGVTVRSDADSLDTVLFLDIE
jgi:hypothetical protein